MPLAVAAKIAIAVAAGCGTVALVVGLAVGLSVNKADKAAPVSDAPACFGIMSRLPGIWNGNIVSSTAAGNPDNWVVDYRPVSPYQVAANADLDWDAKNFISFFVANVGGEKRMTFRNGGGFRGQIRIAYEYCINATENGDQATYFFSDSVRGEKRVYTKWDFKSPTEMVMSAFTTKGNTVSNPVMHATWYAHIVDNKQSAQAAVAKHFPPKYDRAAVDLTHAFEDCPEAVANTYEGDPYSEMMQPNAGHLFVTVGVSNGIAVPGGKTLVMLTTQPIFDSNNQKINGNERFLSRIVYLDIAAHEDWYQFLNIHEGRYWVTVIGDQNGDKVPGLPGDSMVWPPGLTVDIEPGKNTTLHMDLNWIIPGGK